MRTSVHETFQNDAVCIHQYKYPGHLYQSEVRTHEKAIHEYADEILETMTNELHLTAPNMKLYGSQPYINAAVRFKLVDFLYKMLVRLKILPFVFVKGVRLFDRYCLKRIVLLDQAQLTITTCLWIAAKVNGGNNHFANMSSDRRNTSVHTIADLGYGGGARFHGPTERYRLPKLNELIKLCGSRCKYTADMFRQMELHVMAALDWRVTELAIDEYMVFSHELKVTHDDPREAKVAEFFRMKEFTAYAASYVYELAACLPLEMAKVIVDLINHTFLLREDDYRFQTLNHLLLVDENVVDFKNYSEIRRHVIGAIVNAPPYLMQMFDSRGPQLLHQLVVGMWRPDCLLEPSLATSSVFSETSYNTASPTLPVHSKKHTTLCLAYVHNNSTTSFQSDGSPDIFDRGYGMLTPMSVYSDVKHVEKRRAV